MAVKVSTKIKAILKERDAEILSGQQAVKALLEETRKQILLDLAGLPGDGYSAYYLRQILASIDEHLTAWAAGTVRELDGRLSTTWEMGAGLLPTAAEAAGLQLGHIGISGDLLEALKEFTFGKISGVKGDLYNKVRGELTLGVLGQRTPQEVTQALIGDIRDLPIPVGKFGKPVFKSIEERAEVITGTEMGRAFSLATEKSLETARETVPEMGSMWIHAGHPKQFRPIHVEMHGEVRTEGKPFYRTKNGDPVRFPRDPDAPISEVIRCGCTHIPYHPLFGDAAEFAADHAAG
ncbi:MAG: hypothetical protein CVU53_01905 [Deltaproteobacteria bacterium HGW-Deltaproteobacteria-11]|nr:MAG: hypothetical protein CVU53_01905 [Deltaproteobacteria bacterium HGW-Deltaproteobacteria-11]